MQSNKLDLADFPAILPRLELSERGRRAYQRQQTSLRSTHPPDAGRPSDRGGPFVRPC